jgi:hypothetical protein
MLRDMRPEHIDAKEVHGNLKGVAIEHCLWINAPELFGFADIIEPNSTGISKISSTLHHPLGSRSPRAIVLSRFRPLCSYDRRTFSDRSSELWQAARTA